MTNTVSIIEELPTAIDYIKLREAVGWDIFSEDIIITGLKNSCYVLVARDINRTVAMVRVVGDSSFMYLIADMMVLPEYQGKGIGRKLMEKCIDYLREKSPKGSFISLLAAKGKEDFYNKFGFIERPNNSYGSGMMLNIS